jgi:hypothetical protein
MYFAQNDSTTIDEIIESQRSIKIHQLPVSTTPYYSDFSSGQENRRNRRKQLRKK